MITRHMLHDLAQVRSQQDPILSFFLNVDGRERSPIRYVEVTHQLTRSVRDSDAFEALPAEVREKVEANLDMITRFVGAEYEPNAARGLAIYACSGRELWQPVLLSCPVPDGIRMGSRPYLRPLARVLDELSRTLVVLSDREKARLFVVEQGAISELPPIEHVVPGRVRPESWYGLSDSKIERHVDDHIHQHLLQVSDKVREAADHLVPERVLVGGTPDVVPELLRLLPHTVSEKVAGKLAELMIIASPDDVLDRATEQIARAERDEEWTLLEELHNSDGSAGRAALDIEPTLDALYRKAVRVLAVSEGLQVCGFECMACGRLYTVSGDCPACGEAQYAAVEDVVDAAISEAILQDARVEDVLAPPATGWSGLAALLRFPVTPAALREAAA